MPPIQQATLSSPDKKFKTVVTVGSPEAATLQSKGWGLGDVGATVLPAQKALSQVGTTVPQQAQPVAPAVPPAAPEQQPAAPVQQPVAQQAPAPTQPQQPAQQTAQQPAAPVAPAPTAQQATLQSPDGMSKVVVGVGSQEASQLQSQGWKLGAPANASVVTAQQALGQQQQVQQQTGQPVDIKQAQEVAPTFDWEKLLSDTGTAYLDQTITDPITTGLLEKYGVTPPSATGNPVADYAQTYNQLLTSMGLMDVKNEFTKVQDKYAALQNELNDKISAVNDDPWLSEGVRVGQIKSLQDKYQGKLQILNDQQKLYDAMYQQGVQQAQYVANAAYQQQQFNTQTAFNVANLALKEQEAKASLNSAKLRDKLALAQEMRIRAAQDSEDISKIRGSSLAAIKTLSDIFGGSIFDSLPASERRKWEQNAGLPEGTMDYLGKTLEEQKLAQTAALASAKTTRGTTSGGTSTGTVSSGIVTPAGGELKLSPEASAVINNTLRLEDLTPTVRGKIAGELERAGYKSGPKLSSGQQDDIATGNTTIGLIDQILKFNEDGVLEGVGGFYQGSIGSVFTKLFGTGSQEAQSVRSLIGNVRGTIAKLRGGTSFTANEEKLLDSYVPTINESPASVINKLTGLKQFIQSKNQNLMQSAAERGVASVVKDLSNAKNKYNLSY